MRKAKSIALGLTLASAIVADACDSIGENGQPVSVASESALIVWDAKTHTEQFIRTAQFTTNAANLGFLVPTPTPPKLAEVERHVFDFLGSEVYDHLHQASGFGCAAAPTVAAGASEVKSDVDVLRTEQVAGYDASVLAADDPDAVVGWLKSNGYPASSTTAAWLDPYLKKKWTITAFKVHGSGGRADLLPVKMTFRADQPFYPYREPPSPDPHTGAPRTLRVYFIGDEPVQGKLGADQWPGEVEATWELSNVEQGKLNTNLQDVDLYGRTWLTSFLDSSSPRHGTDDVTFSRAPTPIPFGPILVVVGVVSYIRYRRPNGSGYLRRANTVTSGSLNVI